MPIHILYLNDKDFHRVDWLDPRECMPPHGVTHPEKYIQLYDEFVRRGWSPWEPALIGYPFEGGTQLVNGSHRHAAALEAGIKIPVIVYSYEYVRSIWGTDDWMRMLRFQLTRGA